MSNDLVHLEETLSNNSDIKQYLYSDSDSETQSLLSPEFLEFHEFRTHNRSGSLTPPILRKFTPYTPSQTGDSTAIPSIDLNKTEISLPSFPFRQQHPKMDKLAKCREFNGYP